MKVLVAIIAYNEQDNILNCINDLKVSGVPYDIILIDNCSTDRTVEIARNNGIAYISHTINSGSPSGTLTSYFLYAYRNDYDILLQFDGDGQHVAKEIEKIVQPIVSANADYVIGSRFLSSGGFKSYFFRRIGITLFSNIVSTILNQKITDVTSGFRAYSKKTIHFFAKKYTYEIHDTVELLLLSHFFGAKICEVPVLMRERMHGKSEYNFLTSITYPFKGFVNLLGTLLIKNKIKKLKDFNDN